MAVLPPIPLPKQDLREWALKTANYLQQLEAVGKQPSPKIIQLERKLAAAKATTDGLLVFDQSAGVPVYSFNKQWWTLASKSDLTGYVKKTGDTMTGTLTVDGGSGWGLNIVSGYPSIWFHDDNVGGAYQDLGLSAGNGWFRFYVASDTGSSATDIFTINPSGSIIGYVPGVFQKGMTLTSDAGQLWDLRLQSGYPTILFEDTTPSGEQRLGMSGGNGTFRFGPSDANGQITPWFTVSPTQFNLLNLLTRTNDSFEVAAYDNTANKDASRMTAGAVSFQSLSSNGAATRFLTGYYGANNMTIELRRSGSSYNATGTWGAISDERLKHGITDATPKLADLLKLRIVNYVLNNDPEQRKQIGVISQEAGQIFPGLVDADEKGMESFRYSVLTPMFVKALQELCSLLGISIDEDGNLQVAA